MLQKACEQHAGRRDRRPKVTFFDPPPLFLSGYLVSTDAYMNLQLASTEEYVDGKMTGALGEVLVRCNNVLYIRAAPDEAPTT